jgi:U6 snRNA-associated Sm-like protein LSm6
MENAPTSEGKDPSVFLSEIIGAPVIVKLNSGVVFKGMDTFSNIQWCRF